MNGFVFGTGANLTLISVAGNRIGTFAGLSEGSLVGSFGEDVFITYMAGDGNDIALFTLGIDPLADNDEDGLSNSEEADLGTDPDSADSDGDGLPDGYEVAQGFSPLNALDASEDPDGDGFSNLEEFQAGTDPRDVRDLPSLPTLGPALLFQALCQVNSQRPTCRR